MPRLVRLTYASTTTSTPGTLREELTCILAEARQFNFNNRIHGVLLYGNNTFYQCIEGQKTAIDQLYKMLLSDSRHKQIKQLSYDDISAGHFDAWQMKYVLLNDEIKEFFNDKGISKFNPYKLEKGLEVEFLDLLLGHDETVPGQQEAITGISSYMHGKTDNLKYLMVVIITGLLFLSAVYWLMMSLPKAA